MSLVKQLWLGTIVLLVVALSGSFIISTLTARSYLEQQLQLKNIDTANTLALSMSQMDKDLVIIQLLLAAEFDTGHYESIRLLAPDEEILAEFEYDASDYQASPEWFNSLLSISVNPGIAQIQDGWQQYGTLYLESHSRFAHEALWQSTWQFFMWLIVASLVFGFAGTMLLKKIISPLGKVVDQAESIGNQQFVTSDEPKTREFKQLVQAMNSLSGKVRDMLDRKTRELEIYKQRAYQDPLTLLSNRDHFNNSFESYLAREDSQARGSLYLLRVSGLAKINLNFSHDTTNEILKDVASVLTETSKKHKDGLTGRLNGTDFALVSFGNDDSITETANRLSQDISKKLEKFIKDEVPIDIPIAACNFEPNEKRGKLFSLLDGTLTRAEDKGSNTVIAIEDQTDRKGSNAEEWRKVLEDALQNNQISLGNFPVRAFNGDLIHSEMPVRLNLHGEVQPAGYFIGWAIKLDLLEEIDLAVLKLALSIAREQKQYLAINLSENTLLDEHTRHQMEDILTRLPEIAPYMWVEFQEAAAVRNPDEFRYFCQSLTKLGCKVGLEHVGFEFSKIKNIQDLGLYYLKIDGAFIKNVHLENKNHDFLKSLCAIGQQLGITVLAEGVTSQEEFEVLEGLHLDGATGPGVE